MSRSGAGEALIVDPGDEPERVSAALSAGGLRCVGILVTHSHFDHVGAVSPLARKHGAPVYISGIDAKGLLSINDDLWEGVGPFEPYEADVQLQGDEVLELAGLEVRCHRAPGHAAGHLVYEIRDPADGETVLCVGDVIFRGSVGRTDFADGDWPTLEASIRALYETCPLDAPVLSGHSGPTTLEQELRTNPFLDAIRAGR